MLTKQASRPQKNHRKPIISNEMIRSGKYFGSRTPQNTDLNMVCNLLWLKIFKITVFNIFAKLNKIQIKRIRQNLNFDTYNDLSFRDILSQIMKYDPQEEKMYVGNF